MMEELIVVGNGMAGVACLEQILKHSPKFNVTTRKMASRVTREVTGCELTSNDEDTPSPRSSASNERGGRQRSSCVYAASRERAG